MRFCHHSLAVLIFQLIFGQNKEAMSEINPYEEQDPKAQTVNEAAVMYESSCRSVDDFIASIPADMMQKLAEHAVAECEAGRCIPHEQVKAMLKERMGWK